MFVVEFCRGSFIFPFLLAAGHELMESVRSSGGRCNKERIPFQSHFGTLSQFIAEQAEIGRLTHGVRVAVWLVPKCVGVKR